MMREILTELRKQIGVRGSLLVSRDGVIVATELGDGLDPESVAALTSQVIAEATRAAEKLSLKNIRRMMLTSSFGRLLFEPLGELVLVVATEPGLDVEHLLLEIARPARRIREQSRLDSTT